MKKGVISVFFAYVIWGFFPIYFKLLHDAPAIQIMTHRVTWSFIFLFILVSLRKEVGLIIGRLNKKIILIYLAAGLLLSINWLTYVWGVNAGFVVETSLGYFINPLVSVSLGMIFLRERLRPLQWVPVGLAAIGVIYLTILHGSLPWIALVLAFSFGFYGLFKKIAPLPSIQGVTLETAAIFIPALAFLLFSEFSGIGIFGHSSALTSILLALSGIVTAIPLILFATGAPLVTLSTIGLLQYVAPTIQFLIGVFLFGEPFSQHQLLGFSIIWLALLIFSVEGYMARRKTIHNPTVTPVSTD